MKLISCSVDHFGRLTGVDISFEAGLNVFCRENGWGKTTLATFLKAMFYGLGSSRKKDLAENERAHYQPWQGGTFGGALVFEAGGKRYRVERTFGTTEKADTFALYDADTLTPSDDYTEALGEELFGIDAEGFERSTYFSERADRVKADYSDVQARLVNLQDFDDCEKAVNILTKRARELKALRRRGGIIQVAEDRRFALDVAIRDAEASAREAADADREAREKRGITQELQKKQTAVIEKRRLHADILARIRVEQARAEQERSLYENAHASLKEAEAYCREPLPTPEILRQAEEAAKHEKERLLTVASMQEERRRKEQAFLAAREEAKRREDALAAQIQTERTGKNRLILLSAVTGIGAALMILPVILVKATAGRVISALIAVLAAALCAWANVRARQCSRRVSSLTETLPVPGESDFEFPPLPEPDPADTAAVNALLAIAPMSADPTPDAVLTHILSLRGRATEAERMYQRAKKAGEDYTAFRETHPADHVEAPAPGEEEALQKEEEALRTAIAEAADSERVAMKRAATLSIAAAQLTELRQEAADLDEKLPELRHRLEIIERTIACLCEARERLTAGYLDRVQEKFSAYVRKIGQTDAEVADHTYFLTPSFEVKVREGVSTYSGETVSRGTRDLLALCLRLALRDAIFEKEDPPLILDDPFLSFDDERVRAALDCLADISRDKQIVYLVCHSSRT